MDGGSSTDIIFLKFFERKGANKVVLRMTTQPLIVFNNEKVMPIGVITLKVYKAERVLDIDF